MLAMRLGCRVASLCQRGLDSKNRAAFICSLLDHAINLLHLFTPLYINVPEGHNTQSVAADYTIIADGYAQDTAGGQLMPAGHQLDCVTGYIPGLPSFAGHQFLAGYHCKEAR